MIMNVLPIGIQRVSITDSKQNIVYVVFLRMFLDSNSVLLLFAAHSFSFSVPVLLRVCFVCCCTIISLFFILSCKYPMPMQPRCLNKLAETIFKMNNTSGWARCSILLLCFSLSLSLVFFSKSVESIGVERIVSARDRCWCQTFHFINRYRINCMQSNTIVPSPVARIQSGSVLTRLMRSTISQTIEFSTGWNKFLVEHGM